MTFARPEESRAFRRCLDACERVNGAAPAVVQGKVGTTQVVVAHTGIGPGAAKEAIAKLLGRGTFRLVIGGGFAGALDPRLAHGDTVLEELPSRQSRRIVSAALPVETVAEKRALRAKTGAVAVDMETETLSAACEMAGVPFVAIRAISDVAEADLPVPFAAWFDLPRQRARPLGLIAYLTLNPRKAAAFYRFVRGIPRVSAALGMAIEGCIHGLEHT